MKKTNLDVYQSLSGLFLFCVLASGITALCLLHCVQSLVIYVLAGCAAAFFLAYLVVCSVAAKRCEHGASLFLLAWAIVIVSVIILSFLPIAAIMWAVESLVENARKSE